MTTLTVSVGNKSGKRKPKLTFEEWMREIDRLCSVRTGCGVGDLPDCPFSEWFAAKMTPKAAIAKAVRRAKCDE